MSDDLPLGFVSLADHIAELRRDPERAKALDEAREPVLRDIIRALLDRLADRDALAAENARLREALRLQAITYNPVGYRWTCALCKELWTIERLGERHAPGCLAAPKEPT